MESSQLTNPFQGCQWVSTETFEGYVKGDLPFKGRGHHMYLNGDQVYYGEWTNGQIHRGIGILTLENSKYKDAVFIGGWKNGEISGYLIILECNKENPETIEYLRCESVKNEEVLFSREVETPITKSDFIWMYNLFIMNVLKDHEYRAF